jgi:hypothetical protein
MNFKKFLSDGKAFIARMNDKGVPAPMIRDPKTLEGSVSLTLVFLSSVLVIVGVIGKWSGKLGGIDMSYAMQFFWTSCSLYWGRKFQSKDVSFSDKELPKEESAKPTQPDNPDA